MTAVTLCLTIGRRPELLRQTLSTLLSNACFEHVIAINDFRDEATNLVFKELCPDGTLISLDRQLGHHAAVDHMYGLVQTPWVFHCEDDWLFEQPIDLQRLTEVLRAQTWMSGVCLRKRSDFSLVSADESKVLCESYAGLDFYRLDKLHAQWHGYTFNPHLASARVWREFAPFASFKKERHISRTMRKRGLVMAYWADGGCSHLGADQSVSYPRIDKKSFWKRLFGQ